MAPMFRYRLGLGAIVAGLIIVAPPALAQSHGVLREVWTGIPGTAVADLTSAPSFPANPSSESVIEVFFETPTDVMDHYGQRLRALITAPATGNYTFWIAGDDNCELWLSDDDSVAGRELIASVPGWTSSRQWSRYPEQSSAAIRLAAGRTYYIEALMKEHGGGDNLAVRWRLPNGTMEEPIPASRLEPFGLSAPEVTSHPRNVTVSEGAAAVLEVVLARYPGVSFQWQRDGVDIAGANEPTLVLEGVALADSGSAYRVKLSNSLGEATSNSATLTVRADTTRPEIESVVNFGDPNSVTVLFSEPLEESTAADPAHYSIDRGIEVISAGFVGEPRTVLLKTSPLTPGVSYRLTVTDLRDRATAPNTVAPGTTAGFSWDYATLPIDSVLGRSEPLGPSSRVSGLIVSELMYHPAERPDGVDLEYIELFNTHDWDDDLSGFRLSGSVDFAFPEGTVIPARGFLVVAAAPTELESAYDVAGVLGPWEGSLPNDAGVVRLRTPIGGVYQEIEYLDRAPWPMGADGTGHSIVMARPSYGENDARAWRRSELIDGSPGEGEPASGHPYHTVLINELLAHTDDPVLDYVELFNYSPTAVDLSGCVLTDDPDEAKYVIADGTRIAARGYLAFDQNELGFALESGGERILFKSPDGSRVIDAVRFGGQENGVSMGRYPDGAPDFHTLRAPTPAGANATLLIDDIVINEVMYHPMSEDSDDEYVELFNQGTQAVELSGWKLRGEIRFTFPEGTVLGAGDYLVLAKNAARIIAHYDHLDASNTLGDFKGTLNNRSARIALEKPDEVIDVTPSGPETNTIWILVDEVTYSEGKRWGEWADGGGSSLELIDPRSDNRLASSWADSDETGKGEWTTVEHTGVLDNGQGAINELHALLLGSGECLLDDLHVSRAGQANQLPNPDLESGLDDWVLQGNHIFSRLSGPGAGYGGGKALHLVATGAGDNGANRVESDLNTTFSSGQTATIRARAKWLKGSPLLLLRLHGNHLEASGELPVPANLGTPGLPNSRAVINAGPAIFAVEHQPVLPKSGQAVTVTARVSDPDGFSSVSLKYRIDPSTDYATVSMAYRGAGLFSAEIPGQSAGELAAFYVEAADGHAAAATTTFPAVPARAECLVRFGARMPSGDGGFGVYRFWVGAENLREWRSRVKLSNQLLDTTFVYGDFRAIYNVGGRFRGSPFIRPGYSSPASSATTAMVYEFPKDERFLGADKINLDGLEQPGRDNTLQREKMSMWIGEQLGVPFSYQRYVHLYVNGTKKGKVYTDSHQPDSSYVRSWFPKDADGELFKIDDWFEFNDSTLREFNVNADLRPHTTTGGVYKQARYRWSWEKKTNGGLDDDYGRLFDLVDALNTNGADAYTAAVETVVDVDQWMRVFATRHIVADWDGYGYDRGKNQSAYKPPGGRWRMLLWDLDFSLGGGSRGATASMFSSNDSTISRMYNHPPFRRAYYRAWQEAIDGPLTASQSSPVMDAIYAAFQANGVSVTAPTAVKTWIRDRRNYLINQLRSAQADFEIGSNSGADFSTSESLLQLTGTAPVEVTAIRVNGVEYPVTWTGVNDWRLGLPLGAGVNLLRLEAFDYWGNPIPSATDEIRVTYTGQTQLPSDYLVINEIMYHPATPDTAFVELFNRSTTHAFDLSGLIMNGLDFTFADGTVIEPNDYAVVVNDFEAFAAEHGGVDKVVGEFKGRLDNGGETIGLVERGATPDLDLVIDEVSYEDDAPWPGLADGQGPSLQLIDPVQDNNRVANWAAVAGAGGSGEAVALVEYTAVWTYDQSGDDLGTDWRKPDFDDSDWDSGAGLLYVENSALPGPKNTLLTREGQITYYFRHGFDLDDPSGLELNARVIVDDGAIVYLNGVEILRVGMPSGSVAYDVPSARTVSNAEEEMFLDLPAEALRSGRNVIAVEVHQTNTSSSDVVWGLQLEGTVRGTLAATPGELNSTRASGWELPTVWLNEVQPRNSGALADARGDLDPWVELHNSGAEAVDLEGFFLSDDYAASRRWAFPAGSSIAPGQFLVVWLDGEPDESIGNEWHTSFALTGDTGSLVLTRADGAEEMVVDYLNWEALGAARSYGAYPDGAPGRRRFFLTPTPGSANDITAPPVAITINEWMADNLGSVVDPADGGFEDWFELYNAGPTAVDLSGYYLSDDPLAPTKHVIPAGVIIPGGAYLLFWADEEVGQASATEHHVNFKLSLTGETILLVAPDETVVDQVAFEQQAPDVSEGRWPDGGEEPFLAMDASTPGRPNLGPAGGNRPPTLDLIGEQVVNEGTTLAFTASASDPDAPGQTLRYSLDPGAPLGAVIDPVSGLFTWTPDETFGPGFLTVTIRVTDNGQPPLSDVETIDITVSAAPQIDETLSLQIVSPEEILLSWTSNPGSAYRLQSTTALGIEGWTDVVDLVAEGETASVIDTPPPAAARFYRVLRLEGETVD